MNHTVWSPFLLKLVAVFQFKPPGVNTTFSIPQRKVNYQYDWLEHLENLWWGWQKWNQFNKGSIKANSFKAINTIVSHNKNNYFKGDA